MSTVQSGRYSNLADLDAHRLSILQTDELLQQWTDQHDPLALKEASLALQDLRPSSPEREADAHPTRRLRTSTVDTIHEPDDKRKIVEESIPSRLFMRARWSKLAGPDGLAQPPGMGGNASESSSSQTGQIRSRARDKKSSSHLFSTMQMSVDDPCYKFIPACLTKWDVNRRKEDWRMNTLFIVYGDQERWVGPEERPLALFKQLEQEGKQPKFVLRKLAQPEIVPNCSDVTIPGGSL